MRPFVIGAVLLRAPAVREVQVRQTERGADIAAIIDGACDPGTVIDGACDPGTVRPADTAGRAPHIRWADAAGDIAADVRA